MSGNASRKYKKYKLMQERKRYFGDVGPRGETGNLDLVAYSAAQGRVITTSTAINPARQIALWISSRLGNASFPGRFFVFSKKKVIASDYCFDFLAYY